VTEGARRIGARVERAPRTEPMSEPSAPIDRDRIDSALRRALDRRAAWLASLEGTDCVRLMTSADGVPGLSIDR
jgi:23S rRNA G2069 N7-methylase RlmK/C1962 C5-methylase RlmI